MATTCPHCQTHFPKSDSVNSRHKAVCVGWQEAVGSQKPLDCLCGHESTSNTQMKRHRLTCEVWRARPKVEVQQARSIKTLQTKYGAEVTNAAQVPEVCAKAKATNLKRYGANSPFSKTSSIYDKVRAANNATPKNHKRGQESHLAKPEVKEKIRQTNLARYGVANPMQSAEVFARARATNLERYGAEEPLSLPHIREQIVATNQVRYGGAAPSNSPEVVEKARQTNLGRWGVEWTNQDPDVRRRQVESQFQNYGTWFFASDEGRTKVKNALIERYGVDHPAKIEGHWERAVATFHRKYGAAHPLLLVEFLEKRRVTCQARFGVDHPLQNPEVYARLIQTVRANYGGVDNVFQSKEVKEKIQQTYLNSTKKISGPNQLEAHFGAANPELLYTGNGAFWRFLPKLGHHKNPDFIVPGPDNSSPKTGVTKVLEVFGNYWHSKVFTGKCNADHEREIVEAYQELGFNCCVVWEEDFRKRPAEVRARVQTWLISNGTKE